MYDFSKPVFIGSHSTIDAAPIADAPNIMVWGEMDCAVAIHLGDVELRGEALRVSAIEALDKLAAAVQTMLLGLAPERFAQPGPDDPDDEPTDEPYDAPGDPGFAPIVNEGAGVTIDPHAPIVVHEPWGEGEGVVLDAATILRHGIEGQLRAAYGDR